jgi:hypothetical protein
MQYWPARPHFRQATRSTSSSPIRLPKMIAPSRGILAPPDHYRLIPRLHTWRWIAAVPHVASHSPCTAGFSLVDRYVLTRVLHRRASCFGTQADGVLAPCNRRTPVMRGDNPQPLLTFPAVLAVSKHRWCLTADSFLGGEALEPARLETLWRTPENITRSRSIARTWRKQPESRRRRMDDDHGWRRRNDPQTLSDVSCGE